MFLASKKFVTVAALAALTLVGCAKQPTSGPVVAKPNPAQPEPPKFNAAKPVEPKKPVPPFTLEASDGWSLVNYVPLKAEDTEPQLIAIFERDLDEEVSVRAGVIAGNLPADEADSYIEDIRAAAHSRSNAKVLKERIFKIGTLRAYELIEARIVPAGPQIYVTLATTDGKVGYVISCGGDAEQAERVLPVCAELVEGFRLKDVK